MEDKRKKNKKGKKYTKRKGKGKTEEKIEKLKNCLNIFSQSMDNSEQWRVHQEKFP